MEARVDILEKGGRRGAYRISNQMRKLCGQSVRFKHYNHYRLHIDNLSMHDTDSHFLLSVSLGASEGASFFELPQGLQKRKS